jgi:type I restriction enzyme S subunit
MSEHSLLLQTPPPQWRPATLEQICQRVQAIVTPAPNGERLYLGLEHLSSGLPRLVGRGKESDVRSAKTMFERDDVLFGKLRPYLRKSLLATQSGMCSTDILVFRPSAGVSPDFLSFLTHTDEFIEFANATTAGVQHPRTSWTSLSQFGLHLPPFAEQEFIAATLSKVLDAIEHEEDLERIASELKAALVNTLFSEGLRNEPTQDTEIGTLPKSWSLEPCDRLCERVTVGVVVKPASYYVAEGVPAFRSFNIQEDHLNATDLVYFSAEDNDGALAKSKLRAGDVLIVRTGYPGTSCVVPAEYDGSNCIDLVIARPNRDTIRPGFLSRFFNSPAGKSQAVAAKHGLAQQHLNVSAVKRTLVPVPPIDEQDEIDDTLQALQQRLLLIDNKKTILTELFGTLRQQLFTGRVRAATPAEKQTLAAMS